MKAAYIGIDLLYPALPALRKAGGEILKIFTCETDNKTEFNTKVCRSARKNGIPLQTERIRKTDLTELRDAGCEMVLCGGYYYKIPIIEGMKMINIHPSLLPIGRGPWPMPVTILKQLPESGVTIHKMTEEMDAGDILMQERIPVAARENLKTLTDKQRALLPGMVRKLCRDLDRLWAEARPQGDKPEYWPCPTEKDWTITEYLSLEKIDRILRAFYGYEVICRTRWVQWNIIGGKLRCEGQKGMVNIPFAGKVITAEKAKRQLIC